MGGFSYTSLLLFIIKTYADLAGHTPSVVDIDLLGSIESVDGCVGLYCLNLSVKFIGHSAIVVGHSLHSIAGTLGELLRRACSHLACLGVGVVEVIGGGFHDVKEGVVDNVAATLGAVGACLLDCFYPCGYLVVLQEP